MELTPEQEEDIAYMAENFRQPDAIARYLGLDLHQVKDLLNEPGSWLSKVYWPAYEVSLTEVNKSIVDMAKRDSSPAQKEAISLAKAVIQKLK